MWRIRPFTNLISKKFPYFLRRNEKIFARSLRSLALNMFYRIFSLSTNTLEKSVLPMQCTNIFGSVALICMLLSKFWVVGMNCYLYRASLHIIMLSNLIYKIYIEINPMLLHRNTQISARSFVLICRLYKNPQFVDVNRYLYKASHYIYIS